MRLRTTVSWLIFLGATALGIACVYTGVFNVAADVPHTAVVYALLETIRDRSIAVRARQIAVPTLGDAGQLAAGARDYAEMCATCHLEPGAEESELRQGLYPKPPDLTKRIDASAPEMFWVIKHGIKMSAMPAWGATHDDQRIWSIVAFVQQLPSFSPQQYQEAVGTADAEQHAHDAKRAVEAGHAHHTHHHHGPHP